jgi:nucleotidyltransferase substrate binding protein (TIGR01987 family)
MESINQKITVLSDALVTLADSIVFFHEWEEIFSTDSNRQNERFFLSARDSIIQRFEYCVDLFWKVIKMYLEREKIDFSLVSPRGVLRASVKAQLMSEIEGDQCMKMVESRNRTSHIYHEEMAQNIAHKVPEYYDLMKKIVDRMQSKMKN